MARSQSICYCRRWCAFHAAALLVFGLFAVSLSAQSFDATNLHGPQDLGAKWLVHGGDDPAYAQPGFDDSGWTPYDPSTSLKGVIGNSRPAVVWYRLHVKVVPNETALALSEWQISSAFEIYVNGKRIMQTGQVAPFVPSTFSGRLLERIPDSDIATGSVVIALRVHISTTEWDDQYSGYYINNLTLGQETALREHIWLTVIGDNLLVWIDWLFGLGLGIVALALFAGQRRHWEYLWIFLQFFCSAARAPLASYELFHNVPVAWNLIQEPLDIAGLFFSILMYVSILRIRFGWFLRILSAAAALGVIFSVAGTLNGSLGRLTSVLVLFPLLILVAGVLPVMLLVHLRRGNREAGILLIPAILSSLTIYLQLGLFFLGRISAFADAIGRVGLAIFNWHAGPFALDLNQLSTFFYMVSLAVIMVLRSTRISRQQALLEGEMAAAREVQQVILPEEAETIPGFEVESVYQPAQEVGGDFFQILHADNGSLLVVVGDVAGKGLPAAMLVSVLVGAIRGVAEYTSDPAELLANLNDRLVGRVSGSFSTALVAHIAANGMVTIANAGHLSPYLDGREVELLGELPLGVRPNVKYETTSFYLAPASRLTFYSDGVVEAQSDTGELFGFERGREISTEPAATIVEAARKFGQQDDITVVAITRAEAVATAA
jgi:hypothetical protein